MRQFFNYCTIAFSLLSIGKCLAQTNYSVAHYTGDNGLPQNSIKAITEDAYGFLWLGTEDGLVRFDGREFNVYNKLDLNIPNNRVLSIHWIKRASYRSGMARNQTCIVDFQDNTSSIIIENGMVRRDTFYDSAHRKNLQFLNDLPGPIIEANDSPNARGLNFKFERYLVYAGDEGEHFYVCDSAQVKYYHHRKVLYRVPFSSNNLWNFFSLRGTLYYFDNASSRIVKISNSKIDRMALSGKIIEDPAFRKKTYNIRLFWNHNSDQAFLILKNNLYILLQAKDGSINTELLIQNFDFDSKFIKHIHFDPVARKVFLGSGIYGLYVLTKTQFRTLSSVNFPNKGFYGQLPYSKNTIISPRGGIVGIDSLDTRIIQQKAKAFAQSTVDDDRQILRDKTGNIWIRNITKLVQKDSLAKMVLRTIDFGSEVRAICLQDDKWLWFGVLYQGLYRIDTTDPKSDPELILRDSGLKLTCLEPKNRNELLVGTINGLFSMNVLSKKIRPVPGADSLYIKSIHMAGRQGFWVTAQESGLMLLTKAGKIVAFPLDKKRYLASAHCAIDDGNGYLWVTSNKGLFQMSIPDLIRYANYKIANPQSGKTYIRENKADGPSPVELFYTYHTMEEGFNINEFNGSCMPCAVKLANGYISLPSMDGLVWFKPELINNSYLPNDSILIDRVEVGQGAAQINAGHVNLPLAPKNIRIYFTTAYLGNTYNLNMSYALLENGQNPGTANWTPIENQDFSIRYSSLESGQYTLLIRKVSGYGINNIQTRSLQINVPLFWYETTWARVGLGLSFVFILVLTAYYYNKYKVRSVEVENIRLEGLVYDRTADALGTLRQLEQSKSELSNQIYTMSRVLTSITHDIQSPLKYIAYSSANIPTVIRNGRLEDAAEITVSISDLAYRMSVMLGDLLDYIRVQVYGKGIQFEDIGLRDLIEDKLGIFNSLILKNSSKAINLVPEDVRVSSDYLLLSIIVHNLLDNASKFTQNGIIRISCEQTNSQATELVITNSGKGISKEMIELLNASKRDASTEIEIKDKKVTGLGLLIVKEIADLLEITIHVDQTELTHFHLFFANKTNEWEPLP